MFPTIDSLHPLGCATALAGKKRVEGIMPVIFCVSSEDDVSPLGDFPARGSAQDQHPVSTFWSLDMYALLIIAFGFLQVADGVVTYLGLSLPGLQEVNPVLNFSAKLMGLGYSIFLIKMAGLTFITLLFVDRHKMKSRWITATLTSAVAFYSWVVTNNVILVIEA